MNTENNSKQSEIPLPTPFIAWLHDANVGIVARTLYYWHVKMGGKEFYKTMQSISKETGLTHSKVATALRKLRSLNLIKAKAKLVNGVLLPPKLHFIVDKLAMDDGLKPYLPEYIPQIKNAAIVNDFSYQDYIQSPAWEKLRKKAFSRANGKCELCGEKAENVHHVQYPKHFKDDCLENLVAVCQKCHRLCHGIRG
jgi:hypothetical protein